MKEYTTKQIAEELGFGTRKVQSMLANGYFKASVKESNGHPSKRIFNEADLVRAKMAVWLWIHGFTPYYIRHIMQNRIGI